MARIIADDVSVSFPLYGTQARGIKNVLFGSLTGRKSVPSTSPVGGLIEAEMTGKVVVKALEHVSFRFEDGDRIGIVGHNGSGKTTLLRTLCGILEPTGGRLTVEGATTPMFGLSDGMNLDLSGIDNIWLRGKLLGSTPRIIRAQVDDIVAFSELGDYIHMPVRTYSSGMLIRLGFAIATSLRPEILVMDEMIGAGDAGFIDKARERLVRMVEEVSIAIVATHGMNVLKEWCNKAMLLEHGRVVAFGPVGDIIERYTGSRD